MVYQETKTNFSLYLVALNFPEIGENNNFNVQKAASLKHLFTYTQFCMICMGALNIFVASDTLKLLPKSSMAHILSKYADFQLGALRRFSERFSDEQARSF